MNAFLRHHIQELRTFKNGPLFWPTLYFQNSECGRPTLQTLFYPHFAAFRLCLCMPPVDPAVTHMPQPVLSTLRNISRFSYDRIRDAIPSPYLSPAQSVSPILSQLLIYGFFISLPFPLNLLFSLRFCPTRSHLSFSQAL